MTQDNMGIFFWGFLILYGFIMNLLSPKDVNMKGFFKGSDESGKDTSLFFLTGSLFISWIFAKSVTNAANLGAKYGIVGGVAYALYWLCIPVCGLMIYRLRKNYGAKGIVSFLRTEYGIGASIAFSIVALLRLFNEIWSNTSVVGGYYGAEGSKAFIIAASLFTLVTLLYTLRGGLRSAIVTDVIQAIIFFLMMVWVLGNILPKHSPQELVQSGVWSLEMGVDLILVTLLQLVSYPFHDPVLTDRAFITEEKVMLKAFFIAGILGFFSILAFSMVGVHASLNNLEITSNVPVTVGHTMGFFAYFIMTIVMVSAAGSTLDSTFASLAKISAQDIPQMFGKSLGENARKIGIVIMILFAILGNIPMIIGTDILKATTISGTMVIGLAPVFLLHGIVKPTKVGFHLSFWTGIILGVMLALNLVPDFFAIGNGDSNILLGVNLYGSILCFLFYIIPGIMSKRRLENA